MTIKKIVKPVVKAATKPSRKGVCSTCGRRDNDGGPLCMNIFCPGGN